MHTPNKAELSLAEHPTVVYTNHPSFWDPLISGQVISDLLPSQSIYAPIDSNSLKKFWYFNGLGFFALKINSRHGLRTFLKVGKAVLEQVDRPCLVLAPEGRFTEPTARPIHLKRGLSKLLSSGICRRVQVVPLALDYRLGEFLRPEAWATFGNPFMVEPGAVLEQSPVQRILEKHLTEAMDRNLELIQKNQRLAGARS